ncbi:MAG: CHAT domain-containing protein, partial [Cyanobacteria bacterium P01_F01_bin.3]
ISADLNATGLEANFNTAAKKSDDIALDHFMQSEAIARQLDNPTLQVKALLGQIAVYSHGEKQDLVQPNSIAKARTQATALWEQLPSTQEKVYLALQLTKQHQSISSMANTSVASRTQCRDIVTDNATKSLLKQALTLADALQNNRLKAFAQGEIGHYYECECDYTKALDWSQQARLSASGDRVLALDTLYLWQWQTGRIYQSLGQSDAAVDFYSQAVDGLNRIRSEILASDRTLQFDFRDSVAPVYRELTDIQLSMVPESLTVSSAASMNRNKGETPTENRQQNITAALGNIDNLQLAELQNYFGSDCIVPVSQRRLDGVLAAATPADGGSSEASTALVSTIIFPERTAVILTLPGQTTLLHWINVLEPDFQHFIKDFRDSLENTSNELGGYDNRQAQRLYQQIIAPFQPVLTDLHIKTLVFVNDGILRSIPMGALHDGSKYLIEQYAVAIAPSLQRPVELTHNPIPSKALILGLKKDPIVDGQRLGPLPAVEREVKNVKSVLPNSEVLLDEDFTKINLQESLIAQSYPVLHIATHGKFETEPRNTFLVMGDKELSPDGNTPPENKLLRLGELDSLIRSGAPQDGLLDLIVLSACQTGSGDERSTLGLAGVAIRAGADAAIASLWSVDDNSTADLITAFYKNWDSGMSKAEALQQAQITVMKTPEYWGSG